MHRTPGTAQDDEKVISWTGLRHVSNARVQELDTGRTFRIMTRTGSMNTLKTLTFAATTALAVATFTLPGAQAQTAKQMQEPQGGSGLRRMLANGRARCSMPDCRYPRRSEPYGRTGRLFGPVERRLSRHLAEKCRGARACRTAPWERDALHESGREGEDAGVGCRKAARGRMRDREPQETGEASRRDLRAPGWVHGRTSAGKTFHGESRRRRRRHADRRAHLGDFTERCACSGIHWTRTRRRLAPVPDASAAWALGWAGVWA